MAKKKAAAAPKAKAAPKVVAKVAPKKVDTVKAEAEVTKAEEALVAEHEAEVKAVMHLRDKQNAGIRDIEGQHLITMTGSEKAEVEKLLAKLRTDKFKKSAGPDAPKRYVVVSTPVRVGGISFNIEPGRYELTPEFVAQNFPAGTTMATFDSTYASKFKVESEAPAPDPASVQRRIKPSPAELLVDAEGRNLREGKGIR